MVKAIQKYLEAVSMGGLQTYKKMAILPLLSEKEVALDYYTLDEALNANALTITEVSQGGTVPNLKLVNHSHKMVLIMDGEELVGAKQNRIVNITMLIGGLREVIIPVSCVEQGRWSYKGKVFFSEGRVLSACMRMDVNKDIADSIRVGRGFCSDQNMVWAGISKKAECLKVSSPTEAMSDIYSQKMDSLDEYVKAFQSLPNQVGMIFFIGNMVTGLDAFGKTATLEKMYRKLVSSYAIEVLDSKENPIVPIRIKELAQEFMDSAMCGNIESNPSVNLGTDVRIEGNQIIGSGLVFEDQVLHLALFSKISRGSINSKIHGPSRRRDMMR